MKRICAASGSSIYALVICPLLLGVSESSLAFGDDGHEIVAAIARQHMTPQAVAAADRLLALDTSQAYPMRDKLGSTSSTWARQATWADYYRDSQRRTGVTPDQIHSYFWHFADIELTGGTLEVACYGFPKLAQGTVASDGQDPDCVVNKIEQFSSELASDSTPDIEKAKALKYLLHFVGDLHQPLHASDNSDHGGNDVQAIVDELPNPKAVTKLHGHWDNTFVQQLIDQARKDHPGSSIKEAADVVPYLRQPSSTETAQWLGAPNARSWALESFALARAHAYALPKPVNEGGSAVYHLDKAYCQDARSVTQDQLLKAGYRLAAVLNQSLTR